MSFLAPLFLLGTLAVVAPLVFHLVRRTPRGRHAFSSLMFLRASPPRVQRRSRIEDWLLLLMRIGVICLVAFAFARPFIPVTGGEQRRDSGRRIAVLLDTSASMRRDGLWDEAIEKVRGVFEDADPGDRVTLFTFDDRVKEVLGSGEEGAPVRGAWQSAALDQVRNEGPTWGATDLGAALVTVADRLDAETDGATRHDGEIVLISDLQRGSRLGALDRYAWPRQVRLRIERLTASTTGNAGILAATTVEGTEASGEQRVQILNEGDDENGTFTLQWMDEQGETVSDAITDIVIPAGAGRVVTIPHPPVSASLRGLILGGDAHDFDNRIYLALTGAKDITMVYLGSDPADDPEGARYFLERALAGTPSRPIEIFSPLPNEPLVPPGAPPPHLVIGGANLDPNRTREVRDYLHNGGSMLCVLGEGEGNGALGSLLGLDSVAVEDASPDNFALLGEIEFTHPLFARFADPRFNDFTAIRFWRYRALHGLPEDDPRLRVLARFDDGAPYLLERNVGAGRVLVMTSGWQPRDSRLALSTKFVPLLEGILEGPAAADSAQTDYVVNQRIPLPSGTAKIHRPDGRTLDIALDQTHFDGADTPGVYAFEINGERRAFAVNLDPAESRTRSMPIDELDQRGVSIQGVEASPASYAIRMHGEFEQSQQLWKWALLCAIGLCLLETWIAGVRARAPSSSTEEATA